jgi:hypothetical protein
MQFSQENKKAAFTHTGKRTAANVEKQSHQRSTTA